jgi:hypothetical protein
MASPIDDPPAVIETRVVHDTHRRATTLLADAAGRSDSAPGAVGELRDLVVTMLRHHHESEDGDLWPLLVAADPSLAGPLAELSAEHDRLDDALDRLEAGVSVDAAVEVRDLIHGHLAHEEPILFPALRAHVSDDDWTAFSRRTIASAPQVGTHLLVGLMHEVGSPAEVEVILRNLPPEAAAMVPAMVEQAKRTFAVLEGVSR